MIAIDDDGRIDLVFQQSAIPGAFAACTSAGARDEHIRVNVVAVGAISEAGRRA